MSISTGAFTLTVLRKDGKTSDFGVSVSAANLASNGIALPLISESLVKELDWYEDNVLNRSAAKEVADNTDISVSGNVEVASYYNAIDTLFCMMLGFEHPDNYPVTVGSLYCHVFEMDQKLGRQHWLVGEDIIAGTVDVDDQKVRSFCIGFDKDASATPDHLYEGLMINSASMTLDSQGLSISTELVGRKRSIADYTNANWPTLSDNRRALFSQVTCYIGSIDGDSYDDYEEFYIGGAEININNNLKADDKTTGTGLYRMEPERNDFATVDGSITFTRYESDHNELIKKFDSQRPMKIRLNLVNSESESIDLLFPKVYFNSAEANTEGAGLRMLNMPFEAFNPPAITDSTNAFNTSANDSWSSIIDPGSTSLTLIKNGPMVVVVNNTHDSNVLTEH